MDLLDLPLVDMSGMDERFTEAEVWNIIRSLKPDKAPGPEWSPSANQVQSPRHNRAHCDQSPPRTMVDQSTEQNHKGFSLVRHICCCCRQMCGRLATGSTATGPWRTRHNGLATIWTSIATRLALARQDSTWHRPKEINLERDLGGILQPVSAHQHR